MQVLTGEGLYETPAQALVGRLDPAFRVAKWIGDGYPTIIYHHGTNENPFDRSFNSIFPPDKLDAPVNLIVVRAPYNTSLKAFVHSIGRLENYMAMLAVAVRMSAALVQACHERGGAAVVSGISLRGWITNLHLAYVGTADAYAPLRRHVLQSVAWATKRSESPLRAG